MMRPLLLIPLLLLGIGAGSAADAACYADYKAKREDPLRLHYGVAELEPPCDRKSAARQLEPRLDRAGWTLLNVVSVFEEGELEARRDSAGQNFLRY